MQHVSLAVGGTGGAEVESRLPGVEMALGCAVDEGHGGAAGSRRGNGTGQSSSVLLLGVQLPLTAAHGGDERRPLTAAVLGQQEVDVAFGGEFLHCLLEDPREAGGKRRRGGCSQGAAWNGVRNLCLIKGPLVQLCIQLSKTKVVKILTLRCLVRI